MLEVALGSPGSFCDNCASPATRGYELKGPLSAMFYCECCADRKFGERETQRAKERVLALKSELVGRLSSVITAQPRDPQSSGRPIGFLR